MVNILIEGHSEVVITETQLKNMKHALGLDYKDKSYRNYYCEYQPNKSWDELVKLGLATLHIIEPNELDKTTYYYYHVSQKGAEFIDVKLPDN